MEKVIVIGTGNLEKDYDPNEIVALCSACNYEVVATMSQNIKVINDAYFIGSGKVQEVKMAVKLHEPTKVIFDCELSAKQYANLTEELDISVLDRCDLILDIFTSRAKTSEAKLQVEVAKLKYLLPRLVNSNENYSQQGGGSGVKNKGSGEKEIDLQKFNIRKRINELEKILQSQLKNRQTQRKKRAKNEIPTVALVGYTNAGKSSLMNAIINESKNVSQSKQVFVKDMLFATLETYVRRIHLKDNKTFILSDTVGFINNLPTTLVKAFRSTLEEAINADLLINVIDINDENHDMHMKVTAQTLEEIGAKDIPIIHVFNKVDLRTEFYEPIRVDCVITSTKTGEGISELLELIKDNIFDDYVTCMMQIPYSEASVFSDLCENSTIHLRLENNDGYLLNLSCRKKDYQKYKRFIVE